jgi:hypothetical protein
MIESLLNALINWRGSLKAQTGESPLAANPKKDSNRTFPLVVNFIPYQK